MSKQHAVMMPPRAVEVHAYQLVRTSNDVNGNPRRHYALYGHDGLTIATIEEGYYGSDRVNYLRDAGVVEVRPITVQPGELKAIRRAASGRGGNF